MIELLPKIRTRRDRPSLRLLLLRRQGSQPDRSTCGLGRMQVMSDPHSWSTPVTFSPVLGWGRWRGRGSSQWSRRWPCAAELKAVRAHEAQQSLVFYKISRRLSTWILVR